MSASPEGGAPADWPRVARAGRWLAVAIAIAIMECSVLQPRPVYAQTSTCADLLLRYVGKPLANVLAEKGPAIVASYFTTRLEHSRQARVPDASANRVTLQDITNLKAIYRRNGRVDCDLRADLDGIARLTKSESGPKYHWRQRTPPPVSPPASEVASAAPSPAPPPAFNYPAESPRHPNSNTRHRGSSSLRTIGLARAARADPRPAAAHRPSQFQRRIGAQIDRHAA